MGGRLFGFECVDVCGFLVGSVVGSWWLLWIWIVLECLIFCFIGFLCVVGGEYVFVF